MLIRRVAAMLAVCVASSAMLGCYCGVGRGFSLRGEWLLEMNRGACGGCVDETCNGGVEQGAASCAVSGASPACTGACRGPCVGRPCVGRPCVGARTYAGPLAGLFRILTPPPPTSPAGAECGMYPRFHPVPAQPVFARRNLPRNVGSGFGPLPPEPAEANARSLVVPSQEPVSRQSWVPASS